MASEPENFRVLALDRALKLEFWRSKGIEPASVVQTAKVFEAYLTGEAPKGPLPSPEPTAP